VSEMISVMAGIIVVLAAAWLLFAVLLWVHRPSRERAAMVLRFLPDVARLSYRLARDGDTPRRYRAGLVLLGLYLATPIDIIPDFVPGIGALDDVIIIGLVLRWVGRGVGRERIERLWPGTPDGLVALQELLGKR
jgi:uncharacterized membrane protein YkvA (DUF1232 family)